MSVTIDRIETDIEILNFHDLTEEEQKNLIEYDDYQDSSFFRYRDWVYDLNDFMRIDPRMDEFKGYHGYKGDSFFSGVLIKLNDENQTITAATYRS